MGKLTEEEKRQWKELFIYIEKEILDYDENQKLQKNAVLRLKGLATGKVIANNKTEDNGNYSPNILKVAFMINKNKIKDAIRHKDFDSEDGKLAYICAIVRGSLNSVYEHIQEAERAKKKTECVDTSIMDYIGKEYREQTVSELTQKSPKKFEELW